MDFDPLGRGKRDARRRRSPETSPNLPEARKPASQTAAVVGEEIRAVLESAAAEIRRQSEREARAVRAAAIESASQIRSEAAERARDFARAAAILWGRFEESLSELGGLLEGLRTDVEGLHTDVAELRGNMLPPGGAEPRPELGPGPPASEENVPEASAAGHIGLVPGAGRAGAAALTMALNGAPREETDRYLAENFQLEDRARLLDEVYGAADATRAAAKRREGR